MANPSKAKGTTYEAKIRDILSAELGLKFERVPLSGSISFLKGDIFVPSDTAAFGFLVECKHYAELEWNNLLTAKSTDIHSFWAQTTREAETMKQKPLLVFRWNRSKDFCAWDDPAINLPHQLTINAFGHKYHIALLADWIAEYKKVYK